MFQCFGMPHAQPSPALTVLAVDDCEAVRRITRLILEAAGHQVVTAGGVRCGLRALRVLRPDVILTDFNMPSLTGHDFVRSVRRLARFASTPIVVVSSEQAPETRALMAAAGANAWISKPIVPRDLLSAIEIVRWAGDAADGSLRRCA